MMMPIFVPGFGGVAGTEAAGAVWRGAAAGAEGGVVWACATTPAKVKNRTTEVNRFIGPHLESFSDSEFESALLLTEGKRQSCRRPLVNAVNALGVPGKDDPERSVQNGKSNPNLNPCAHPNTRIGSRQELRD